MASLSVKCVDVAIIDFKLDPFASSGEHHQPTTMRTAIATMTSGSAVLRFHRFHVHVAAVRPARLCFPIRTLWLLRAQVH